MKCFKCRFFQTCKSPVTFDTIGQCKRYPPFPDGITWDAPFKERWAGIWPEVAADDWCGEFAERANHK